MSISLATPPASPSTTVVKSSPSGEGYDQVEDSVNLQHLMKLMSIFQVITRITLYYRYSITSINWGFYAYFHPKMQSLGKFVITYYMKDSFAI